MAVTVFYDPRRVAQLQQRGIDPQRLPRSSTDQAKLALGAIEECAQLRAEVARLRRAKPSEAEDEVSILRAEVAQLRQENKRLSSEVVRLSAKRGWAGWSGSGQDGGQAVDDPVQRLLKP